MLSPFLILLHIKWRENGDLIAGAQTSLSCLYTYLNAVGMDKPAYSVYLQLIKDLVWKPSYNRVIVEQVVKSS